MKKNYRYSIAPMMQYTDRFYRPILRRLCPNAMLYTEMQVASSIVFGKEERFLAFSAIEKPLVLQLASNDPKQIAQAVHQAERYEYDGYNINVGCPSERAVRGGFGVCQMADVELVSKLYTAMSQETDKPISIKHRIGLGLTANEDNLSAFIQPLYTLGVRHFIIHARSAILGRLKPNQNRNVPPLQYEAVYAVKKQFPEAFIEINGGIKTVQNVLTHLRYTDAVMIGRLAYQDPFALHKIDALLANREDFSALSAPEDSPQSSTATHYTIAEKELFLDTILEATAQAKFFEEKSINPWPIIRHLLYLFTGCPGARIWRRIVAQKDISRIEEAAREQIERLQ